MFHRVSNCFGVTLWAWRKRVEIWFCFSGVEPHSHPEQHVDIIPLFGWARFLKQPDRNMDGANFVDIEPRRWLHSFSIEAGWQHWFTIKHRPLIFLNITQGRSAAENFVK
jgi:hypothetical protein